MDQSNPRGQVALVMLLGLLWGLNWPIVKIGLEEYGPWTLRALSLSGAVVVLVGAILARGGSLRIDPREWWRVALPGVFAIAGVNMLNACAQLTLSTGRTAIIAFSMPIWATFLARVFLGEVLDRRRMVALALGLAGLVALGWPLLRHGVTDGLLFAFGSALTWACGVVFMKRFPVKAPPIVAAMWQLLVGTSILIAGMLVFERPHLALPSLTPGLLAILYNAFLAQALGTWLWFEVLGRTSTGVAAIGTLMVPGIGVVGAMALLGETPAVSDWIGLALVVAASASVLLRPRARAVVRAPAAPAGGGPACAIGAVRGQAVRDAA